LGTIWRAREEEDEEDEEDEEGGRMRKGLRPSLAGSNWTSTRRLSLIDYNRSQKKERV